MLTIPVAAKISAIDTMGGTSQASVNLEFRASPPSGGFVTFKIPYSAIAAGTVTIPAWIDNLAGLDGNLPVVDVDLRTLASRPVEGGGFFSTEIPLAEYAAPAAPATPTLGTAVSGSLGALTYKAKITKTGPYGETLPSAEASESVAANSVPTCPSPAADGISTGWNIYLTTGASGTETLQNSSPIAIGTAYQLPNTGATTTGAAPPAAAQLVAGACNLVIAMTAGGALAVGNATVTIEQ